jgi:hypothetical protein
MKFLALTLFLFSRLFHQKALALFAEMKFSFFQFFDRWSWRKEKMVFPLSLLPIEILKTCFRIDRE